MSVPVATGGKWLNTVAVGERAPDWLVDSAMIAWNLDPPISITLISLSENAVFRVDQRSGPDAVLRLHRPGYVTGRAAIDSELNWISAIREDTTVATPGIRPTNEHDLVADLVSPQGEQLWAVMFDYVAGIAMNDLALDIASFQAIGDVAARLHNHAEHWTDARSFSRFDWDINALTGPAAVWGDWRVATMPRSTERLLTACDDSAHSALSARLRRARTTWGPIHADLRRANFIVGDDCVTVLDFDDSGVGWFLYDCAAALDYIDDPTAVRAGLRGWAAGYAQRREHSDSDAEITSHFLMLRRLMLLGWAHSRRRELEGGEWLARRLRATEHEAELYLHSTTWAHE